MAKVSFTKLGLKKNQETKTITWNDQNIEIKQYLPVNEKLELISNVINLSMDDMRFMNPLKIKVFSMIEIIKYYTNISFTAKQLEDIPKLYDLIAGTKILTTILEKIPQEEYEGLIKALMESIEAIYAYKNSLSGVMESISNDYANTEIDINMIRDKLLDPASISMLKNLSSISGFYEENIN